MYQIPAVNDHRPHVISSAGFHVFSSTISFQVALKSSNLPDKSDFTMINPYEIISG